MELLEDWLAEQVDQGMCSVQYFIMAFLKCHMLLLALFCLLKRLYSLRWKVNWDYVGFPAQCYSKLVRHDKLKYYAVGFVVAESHGRCDLWPTKDGKPGIMNSF